MRTHQIRRGLAALLVLVTAGLCVQLSMPAIASAGDGYPGAKWAEMFWNVPLNEWRDADLALCEENGHSGTFVNDYRVAREKRDRFTQFLENPTSSSADLTLAVTEETKQGFEVSASAEAELGYITATLGVQYTSSKEISQGAQFHYTIPANTRARAHYGDAVDVYDVVLWQWYSDYYAPWGGYYNCKITRSPARIEVYVETGSWIDPPEPL